MQKLTKTQVLALFLSSAAASTLTPKTLLNGPSSTDRVPADQTLTTSMSGTECTGNATCEVAGEKCGYFQLAEGNSSNLCVADVYCKAIGKLNGVAWSLQCWEDPAEGVTATQPGDVDVATYISQIEELITKPNVNWNDDQNLFISPKFNFQDGWWIEDAEGKFVETDKAKDNNCAINSQCGNDECCGMWPDQNNTRCMKKSFDGVKQQAGPITFTPSCKADNDEFANAEPENAQDDISKGALAEAAEAISGFYESQLKDAKSTAGYDEMTEEDKQDWDAKRTASDAERTKFFDELKTEIGYAGENFDDAAKAIFEDELLEWARKNFEACKLDSKSINCREGKELKKQLEAARAGKGEGEKNYYQMTKEEREAFDKNWAEQAEKNVAALAAAWIKDNQPAAGENGAVCGAEGLCPEGQCCGYSVPKPDDNTIVFDSAADAGKAAGDLLTGITGIDGLGDEAAKQSAAAVSGGLAAMGGLLDLAGSIAGRLPQEGEISNVCIKSSSQDEGTKTTWKNGLNEEYIHTCMAKKLAATAAATIAVAFSLM